MNKIKSSNVLKGISFVLIPILVLILAFSIFHMLFLHEYGNESKEYTKTENFSTAYFRFVLNQVTRAQNVSSEESNNYLELEDENGNLYYYDSSNYSYDYFQGIENYIKYIIVDKQTNIMYTNIRSTNYSEEIANMKNNSTYWEYVDSNIDTSIEYINKDNIKYNYTYYYSNREVNVIDANGDLEKRDLDDFNIYTYYDETAANEAIDLQGGREIWNFLIENKTLPIYACGISAILLIAIVFYLIFAIGHKDGKEEITLNSLDKMSYELITIICGGMSITFLTLAIAALSMLNYITILFAFIGYIIAYMISSIWLVTSIKRIKAKEFLRSFTTYKIIRWFYHKFKNLSATFRNKTKESQKAFWYYVAFVVISLILAALSFTGLGLLLLIAFWIYVYFRIRKYVNEQAKIEEALKNIYEGKTDIYVDESQLEGILRRMAIYINDIAGGFSNAIQESLKSERLKTELITNVSHDIKTPLTSIINYVDLIKKEDIQNEKIKEYVDILDKKSQRLKKLTEDLVEASKASSGNIKLNLEEIRVKELINQTIGEFKDKFESKNLIIETNMPKEDIKITADNRYMYRIIENLFSNITKYAQDRTRVYIDVKKKNKNIEISIKNISKDRLNISADELMQRFVRGDKSRFTEGSGLGLSIAKSLTELQKGTFDITIDGDLFKVEMFFGTEDKNSL